MQKIGNQFLIFCYCMLMIGTLAGAQTQKAQLTVTNMNNESITTVEPSVPFKLKLTIPLSKGSPNLTTQPEITGTENMNIIERSPTMLQQDLINRSGMLIFTYVLTAKNRGSYTLGPVVYEGKKYDITVAFTSQINKKTKDSGTYKGGAELQLQLGKKSVYVGEHVPFTLTFRSDKNTVKHQLIPPQGIEEIKNFTLDEPEISQQWARTGSYTQMTWQGHFRVEKPGSIMIPALALRYVSFTPFMLALVFPDTETTYSSPAFIEVKPLPEPKRPTMAIGTFDAYSLETDNTKTAAGEALSMRLSLEGRGNLDHIHHPTLTLPESFRSFDSKTTVKQKRGITTKTFEYIVQATQEGNFTIASQRFDYFDPKDATYKSLETEPVSMTVTPGTSIPIPPIVIQQRPASSTPEPIPAKVGSRYLFKWQWSLNWFFLLLMLSIPLYLLMREKRKLVSWYRKLMTSPFSKRVLTHLKRRITQITDKQMLYPTIKKGLSRYFTGNDKVLSDSQLKALILELDISSELKAEWNEFVTQLLYTTDYAQGTGPASLQQLKEMSCAWIDRIDGARSVKKQNSVRKSFFVLFLPSIFCFAFLNAGDANHNAQRDTKYESKNQESLAQRIYELKMQQKLLTQPYQNELEAEITKLKRKHGYTSAPLKKQWLTRMFNYIPFYLWQIFVFCLWTMILLAWHKEGVIMRCMLLSGLFFSSFALIILTKTSREITGFTLDKTSLYGGPGIGYPQKTTLEPFSDVHILSVYPNKKKPVWYHVETPDQSRELHVGTPSPEILETGWVHKEQIKLIRQDDQDKTAHAPTHIPSYAS